MMQKTKLNQQPLGAHFSIAKGFNQAINDAESIGCEAMQIFLHSNRQWTIKPISEERVESFKQAAQQSIVKHFFVHASYLLNLGSGDGVLRKKSLDAFVEELDRCRLLNIRYLVVHPGSHVGITAQCSIAYAAESLNEALGKTRETIVLLENTAGQGSVVGYALQQLGDVRSLVENKERVAFCFDTCHGFAAGYDFTTVTSYHAFWKDFDTVLGLQNLKMFHFNDSKKGLGSRVDRHENIGKGQIGREAFGLILNDARFVHIPKILETPHAPCDALQVYAQDLATLRLLIER